jgi:hypothetical protein
MSPARHRHPGKRAGLVTAATDSRPDQETDRIAVVACVVGGRAPFLGETRQRAGASPPLANVCARADYGEDDFEGEIWAIALPCGRCLPVDFLGRMTYQLIGA